MNKTGFLGDESVQETFSKHWLRDEFPKAKLSQEELFDIIESGRSPVEILIKFFTLKILFLLAVGHLSTLQNQTLRGQVRIVCWSSLINSYPIACTFYYVYKTANTQWKYISPSGAARTYGFSFYLAAALGVSAKVSGRPTPHVPLYLIPATMPELQRAREPRDLRWFMRYVPMLMFLAQAAAYTAQLVRRMECSLLHQDGFRYPKCETPIDQFNFATTLAAMWVTVSSILLWSGNYTWSVREFRTPEIIGDLADSLTANFPNDSAYNVIGHHGVWTSALFLEFFINYRAIRDWYIFGTLADNFEAVKYFPWNDGEIWLAFGGLVLSSLPLWLPFLMLTKAALHIYPPFNRRCIEWMKKSGIMFKLLDIAFTGVYVTCWCLLFMVTPVVNTFHFLSYCHASSSDCNVQLWLWKDPLLDKMFTL